MPIPSAIPWGYLPTLPRSPARSPDLRPLGVPKTLSDICMKCLAKRPAARFQTGKQLADELHRWLAPGGRAQAKRYALPLHLPVSTSPGSSWPTSSISGRGFEERGQATPDEPFPSPPGKHFFLVVMALVALVLALVSLWFQTGKPLADELHRLADELHRWLIWFQAGEVVGRRAPSAVGDSRRGVKLRRTSLSLTSR